ncbi:4-alpha-glucanotransferase [Paraburkholderia caballeronis]|uniref:4-alpha-glucanotransferase n=1 Tax=Paraburkholderia caballeronis TaxID=416943 RepID=A0A1H7KUG3_9BURK|nr:4-alpha-glucanotransferase [Paraburkholderia caballeronis]PXW28170.1 4-alpha-glucanotransferase [Paraburkholderia caballeronis]PXX03536.1 4-alpha-glucanotransferase [Paraburkholderia caballeronis]RAK04280.1 4-alpha-glucanotransferase [Paraburkholderia caballeronis]SED86550.1 4-alpha-glucanotransferase [Paraburkholderia caballeronis]SEK90408.1 4-alpha-glucanotransferase [Paraburkholderia caballeronis]
MNTTRPADALAALAARVGFEVEWSDAQGMMRRVPDSTLAALLECAGLPCATAAQLRHSAAAVNAEQSARRLPPLITAECDHAIELPASAVRNGSRYRIELESGALIDGRFTAPKGGPALLAPVPEPGYHTLTVNDHQLTLAVAPPRCHTIAAAWRARHGDAARVPPLWGVAAQLYGLRRAGDGGIGDYTALATLAADSARHGAAALAVSPTHAMFSADPGHFSPYAPSSRLWLNVAHIDPAARFGVEAAHAASVAASVGTLPTELEALPLIDWRRAVPSKLAVLRALFDRFCANDRETNSPHAQAFDAFCERGGEALEDHARFEALQAAMLGGPEGLRHWRDWPAGLQDPRSADVATFAAGNRREVDFHRFLQWLAADGLQRAQQAARDAGMAIGLVADLAVGCDGAGSHGWSLPHDMLQRVSVGAPPDIFNQAGQSWGLTTFSPRAMHSNGFRAFIDMLRAAFAHAGGVRIDHILGLRRLWLVPEGESARHGAYLRYPFDDLVRLIALESWRHRAIVIGEDLGTVPEGLRERLAAHALYGTRVLWFEHDGNAFLAPDRWDPNGVATTTTHDLATVAGWWRGSDIDWRNRIGQTLPRDDGRDPVALEHERRAYDRDGLWHAFQQAGCAPRDTPAPPPDAAPVDAALRFVGASASPLFTCPLEDLLALADQPNLPGSIDEHPNWRRRLPLDVETLYRDPAVAARVQTIADARAAAPTRADEPPPSAGATPPDASRPDTAPPSAMP